LTYLGGSSWDECSGIALDATGAAYLTGLTESANFPIKNACQKARKGRDDLFLTKFAPDGKTLTYSTFWGGQGYEYSSGIAVDSAGSAYVAGYTRYNIATKKGFQPTRKGGDDVIVAKFAPDGKTIVFSSYLGGTASDWCRGVAVDSEGAAYLVGGTSSYNFPKKNPVQKGMKGKYEAFLTKVAPSGASLVFSTYLGGSYWDYCFGVTASPAGDIYVVGRTNSLDFPVVKPYQETYGKGEFDAFVAKYSSASQAARKRR
jgi:Tol biopolymer transport system component